jgi:DNA end-binding protein Ku
MLAGSLRATGGQIMAARPTWKGYLKLSLVSCPKRLYTATSTSNRISFHFLHKDTHNRIRMVPHDPDLGEVDRADLVKGYEYERDRYIVITDEDLDQVKIESSETIAIERFVDADNVDPIYLDAPYYMTPDGTVAEEAFQVIHEAMRQKKKVAISRVVMSGRERLVALAVRDKGFLVTTLRAANEVRNQRDYFEEIGEIKIEQELLDLAGMLIEQKAGPFDPSAFEDRYQEALLQVVKDKAAGQEPVLGKPPEPRKVVNLMEALKQSLVRPEEKKPAAPSKRGKVAAAEQGGAKQGRGKRAHGGG